jgi:nitrate/nitrite transport system permease protein
MFDPVISLLRPVSPLAWLPIGLLVFQKAPIPAATWTIFICSIWPMIINTAAGRAAACRGLHQRGPRAQPFGVEDRHQDPLSGVLPYMLTGIRLSIGTAWLVIVAAEMLTGGVGIGFWVWDEWNNLKVEHIIIAIFVIGIVGLLLEQMLLLMASASPTKANKECIMKKLVKIEKIGHVVSRPKRAFHRLARHQSQHRRASSSR